MIIVFGKIIQLVNNFVLFLVANLSNTLGYITL